MSKRRNKKLTKQEQEELDLYLEKEKEKVTNMNPINIKNIKLTPKQLSLMDTIRKNKITVVTGPAGTSKTFSSCFTALIELKKLNYKKIIITKPTEIVGGTNLGFLPGTLDEKIQVYMQSFISIFSKMLTGVQLKAFMDEKIIEFVPAQFVRGDTFDDSIIIIDEFQSFDISTLMAIVTRLGKNSKMIFVGDAKQNDINKKYVAVDTFKHILDGVEDTDTFEFNRDDIVRDKILIDIIDNYERLEAQGSLPQTQGNK